MPFKDPEKQKEYCRNYQKRDRETLKNIKVSGILKRGDRVQIFNQTLEGKPILEGEATLVRKLMPQEFQEYWVVDFGNGERVYRWIRAENKICPSLSEKSKYR